MQRFQYVTVNDVHEAADAGRHAGAKFIAGGTTLLDLMKLNVEAPAEIIDINRLSLDRIEEKEDGSLQIGAMVRNSDLAEDPKVSQKYPVLRQALLSGASPQLRNMATTGGNLLQRTRCSYFRDTASACNKRNPGSGCSAMDGYHRMHAVLGTSEQCIATHPSDMDVALTALEATIHLDGPKGPRDVAIQDFYLLPGTTPHRETVVEPGELILYVSLPRPLEGTRSHYLKRRDRASYEFALASAAVVATIHGSALRKVRIALGGVGTKPWRALEAERLLENKRIDRDRFRLAAEAALQGAKPRRDNAFKVELAKRTLIRALTTVCGQGSS